jgi:HD superfamily phosphohydrolase
LPQLRLTHGVQDPVWGRIEITEAELGVLRTSAFTRLNRISQLGMGSFVYPGASHTRTSHSIGALHMSDRIGRSLGLDEKEILTYRFAALLHDIGQFPLSHCIEKVYKKLASEETTMDGLVDNTLASSDVGTDLSIVQQFVAERSRSKAISDKKLGSELRHRDPGLAKAIDASGIDQDELDAWLPPEDPQTEHHDAGHQRSPDIRGLLTSSDFDCDRMDYIRRDAEGAGVNFGIFDTDFLIRSLFRARSPRRSSANDVESTVEPVTQGPIVMSDRIAIRERGMAPLDDYITSRFNMYTRVYFHKTTTALELMAQSLYHELAKLDFVYPTKEALYELVGTRRFYGFDDSFFWQAIFAASELDDHPEVASIANRLVNRKPLKLAYERLVPLPISKLIAKLQLYDENVITSLADEAGVGSRALIFHLSSDIDRRPDTSNGLLGGPHTLPMPVGAEGEILELSDFRHLSITNFDQATYKWLRVYFWDPDDPLSEPGDETLARIAHVLSTHLT